MALPTSLSLTDFPVAKSYIPPWQCVLQGLPAAAVLPASMLQRDEPTAVCVVDLQGTGRAPVSASLGESVSSYCLWFCHVLVAVSCCGSLCLRFCTYRPPSCFSLVAHLQLCISDLLAATYRLRPACPPSGRCRPNRNHTAATAAAATGIIAAGMRGFCDSLPPPPVSFCRLAFRWSFRSVPMLSCQRHSLPRHFSPIPCAKTQRL